MLISVGAVAKVLEYFGVSVPNGVVSHTQLQCSLITSKVALFNLKILIIPSDVGILLASVLESLLSHLVLTSSAAMVLVVFSSLWISLTKLP